jgi:hypothetical protein
MSKSQTLQPEEIILKAIREDAGARKKTHGECKWRCNDHGSYATDCGEIHLFNEGGPKENFHRFCPFCGGVLKVEPETKKL